MFMDVISELAGKVPESGIAGGIILEQTSPERYSNRLLHRAKHSASHFVLRQLRPASSCCLLLVWLRLWSPMENVDLS